MKRIVITKLETMTNVMRNDEDRVIGEVGMLDSGLTIEQVKAFIEETLETNGQRKPKKVSD